MAKTLNGVCRTMQVCWGDGTTRLRFIAIGQPKDTLDSTITYASTGNQLANPAPRDLTAGELAGTVQALLDAIDAEANTVEGIV